MIASHGLARHAQMSMPTRSTAEYSVLGKASAAATLRLPHVQPRSWLLQSRLNPIVPIRLATIGVSLPSNALAHCTSAKRAMVLDCFPPRRWPANISSSALARRIKNSYQEVACGRLASPSTIFASGKVEVFREKISPSSILLELFFKTVS